ncbi:MAG: cell division protein FtsQ/DivIB [Betaproteobacteria bacterium]|nr:cell division protein FtsQ/DivIB [Betaproteobacteria bacterium]
MWDDAAAMRMTANLLYAIAGVLLLYGTAHYVVHLPVFPLRDIQLTGDVVHVTHEQVEAVVTRELRGNFFTMDLAQARAAFEKLPWVRKVNVRRQWPDRLEVAVEEHRPLARWGSTALVSAQGEVFEAATNTTLPVLQGPEGAAPEVVSHFQEFERVLEPIGRRIVQITMSARRAWVLKLDDGTVLELGRDNLESRLAGFVAAYERTVARLPRPSTYIDLRYTNGFAVRSPGLKWDGKKT